MWWHVSGVLSFSLLSCVLLHVCINLSVQLGNVWVVSVVWLL